MNRKASFSIGMLALTGATLTAMAAESEAPPKEVKEMGGLIGNWTGTGTLTMGSDKANIRLNLACQTGAGGWGVQCQARFSGMPGGGVYLENDLFGYDPGTKKYHWFAVTNAGETHNHVSEGPHGDVVEFVHSGLQDGKPLRETIRMVFQDNCRKLELRSETTVAGQVVAVLDAHAHK